MHDATPLTAALDVADWRRRTSQTYAQVRALAVDDPAGAHAVWVQQRDELFAYHPASPLTADARAAFDGLDVAPYDPAYRFEVEVERAGQQRLDVATGTDGVVGFDRIGVVELGDLGRLTLWSVRGYAGGLFLPVRDALAGTVTYGGGRYVLDTIKGADLGTDHVGRLVVDLNFAYAPSCAYDPAWACPLATRANTLAAEVPVGERTAPYPVGGAIDDHPDDADDDLDDDAAANGHA